MFVHWRGGVVFESTTTPSKLSKLSKPSPLHTSQTKPLKYIDDYGVDGDFVESQAFAYLAVRSYLKLPISFPETTGCIKPTTGGKIIKFR